MSWSSFSPFHPETDHLEPKVCFAISRKIVNFTKNDANLAKVIQNHPNNIHTPVWESPCHFFFPNFYFFLPIYFCFWPVSISIKPKMRSFCKFLLRNTTNQVYHWIPGEILNILDVSNMEKLKNLTKKIATFWQKNLAMHCLFLLSLIS